MALPRRETGRAPRASPGRGATAPRASPGRGATAPRSVTPGKHTASFKPASGYFRPLRGTSGVSSVSCPANVWAPAASAGGGGGDPWRRWRRLVIADTSSACWLPCGFMRRLNRRAGATGRVIGRWRASLRGNTSPRASLSRATSGAAPAGPHNRPTRHRAGHAPPRPTPVISGGHVITAGPITVRHVQGRHHEGLTGGGGFIHQSPPTTKV